MSSTRNATAEMWSIALKLAAIAVVFIFTCTVYIGIYNIYCHPLAKYPGPKLWTVTRLSYVYSLWSGSLSKDVRRLHQQYGNVVRIAPNEISFARPDAINDIYLNLPGRPAISKSKVWHGPQPGRPVSVLNALDPKNHQRFRKAMEPGFTDRAVRAQESVIQSYSNLFISHLDEIVSKASDGAVVNIVRWYEFTVFDLIGDLGFGESFNCLQSNELHSWVSLIFNSLRAATLNASLRYYPRLYTLAAFAIPKSVKQKSDEHWQLAMDKVNRRLNFEKQRPDLISFINRDDNGLEGLTVPEIQATASVIIVAGSETTVTVLSGITNYLIKDPDMLNRLSSEIRNQFLEEKEMSLSALQDVVYLNAVIQEGLRLCNPVPVGLPRYTPAGGAIISGMFVPENTFVNVHPLTISLSPEHFHKPLKFCPERWLSTSIKDSTSLFHRDNLGAVQTFGVGPRSCVGKRIALAELRLILSRLVWKFNLEEVDTPFGKLEWMNQRDFTVIERQPFEIRLKVRQLEGVASAQREIYTE